MAHLPWKKALGIVGAGISLSSLVFPRYSEPLAMAGGAMMYVGEVPSVIAKMLPEKLRPHKPEPVPAPKLSGKVAICGVDCHTGDQLCNFYCTGKSQLPPLL